MSTPDFQQLRIFAAVAQARSYRRAAAVLGLSPSAVSQAMQRLEQGLGLALLNRSTRSVALTAAGEQLLAQALPALRQLEQAFASVGEWRETVAGTLRLSVPRSAARLLLAPLVARFLAAYPQVQLELCTQDDLVDIVEQGFDAGVRFAERLPGDMVALPLGGPQRFVVVATPELIARHGAPQVPGDLLRLPCIRQRFASGALFQWEFEQAGQAMTLSVNGGLTVDDQSVALAAALDGVGFAYVYEQAAREHLSSGRLCQVLGDYCPPGTGFALYYPGRRQASPALRAFIELLNVSPSPHPGAPARPAATPG
ncbi:LysR family transcriptional regulator [Paucibacter sp. KCTC 42545]|uniref:LysR family transcriptional regulator n=1 Tax=Paucibacter sp. KCTC 42545 TaxID=1768242 RepID=UPI000733A513|nr:LysR family transcriptional regulator [Paucibacter sp. KCTC 42545]ALT78785.1 transcriptional regulator [Paucibacter sp. KCTC 42545]